MDSEGSITAWIDAAKESDPEAMQRIWERYYGQLVHIVRGKLRSANVARRAFDEEDVALSAFDRFYQGLQQGRFPHLLDREGLWRLLLRFAEGKAIDYMRHARSQKRGGGNVRGESAMGPSPSAAFDPAAAAPTPEFASIMAERVEVLLQRLEDAELKEIATAKLGGYTNREIAAERGISVSTVERSLRLIRRKWEGEIDSS